MLTHAIKRSRKEVTSDVRTNPVRKLPLRNRDRLTYFERLALDRWLDENIVL